MVFIPILFGMEMDVIPAPESRAVFDAVDKLPEGTVILVALVYGPSGEP